MATAIMTLLGSRKHLLITLLLFALVALAVLRSAGGTRLDSYTIDEPWHAVAGVSYVRHGDFALNPEHPPLVKLWVGAWMSEDFHVPRAPDLHEKKNERDWVQHVMYLDNNDAAAQTRTRAAMWMFHGLLLLGLGGLLWRAFGAAWAIGTLAFLAIDPTVGAYLPVVMTDLPVALTLSIAAIVLGLTLATWRWSWAIVLGLSLGLALGSKHSALAGLSGLALCALLGWMLQWRGTTLRENTRRLGQLAAAGVIATVLLWAQYGMRFHAHSDGSDGFNRAMADKIDDLRTPSLREPLRFADSAQLLPRSYLWGLADTLRAGIEGRGDNGVILWGKASVGTPPWYTWPSLIAVKVPLPLLLMSALGLIALWRSRLSTMAKWTLAAVAFAGTAHLASLLRAHTAYAGVRHAMPVVLVLAIFAGAVTWRAWQAPRKAWRVVALLPLAAALALTAREPRLWEYHNELAGGTHEAYRYFSNESMDLGQRAREIRAYYQQEIAPTGQTLYPDYFYIPEQVRAWRMNMPRRVESIQDNNVGGIYDGWFVKSRRARISVPEFQYDADEELKGLTPIARIGATVELWRGHQEQPKARAGALYGRIIEYVYAKGGSDWALVAKRAQEIIDLFPFAAGAAIELGNAQLHLGNRAAARKAYADVLEQQLVPVEELTRKTLEQQIALLDSDKQLAQIAPLRNPGLE